MFNEIRKLPQIVPARAKKKVEVHELSQNFASMYTEQKIDGERFVIQTYMPTAEYRHGITSRVQSVVTGRLTEKTDRVPHLANHPQLPPNSTLDNEFVSSGDIVLVDLPGKFWDKLMEPEHSHMLWLKGKFNGALPVYPHVSNTTSILGSLGPEAVRKQNERGKIWAYCFDILHYKGQSAQHLDQMNRRVVLRNVLEGIDPEFGLILMPAWSGLSIDEITEFFHLITDAPIKGEGLIIKDPWQMYNGPRNWYKLKRDYPADVVLTGRYKVGEEGRTGQMLGMASSLEVGVYVGGILLPIGWVSAIMDGMHNLVKPEEVEAKYKGRVMECRHNGLQKEPTSPCGYTLRHPRFRRWREDKNAQDCTLQNILVETGSLTL
jgi:hypothetical protein